MVYLDLKKLIFKQKLSNKFEHINLCKSIQKIIFPWNKQNKKLNKLPKVESWKDWSYAPHSIHTHI